jgi:hypothetical protein
LALGPQVNFGAKPTLTTPQSFGWGTGVSCSSSLLMRPNNRTVDIVDLPIQFASFVGLLLDKLKELVP